MSHHSIQEQEQIKANTRKAIRESQPIYCYPPKPTISCKVERALELAGCFVVVLALPAAFAIYTLISGV